MDSTGSRVSRLKRFDSHRYLGDRRTMVVYDCDDPNEFSTLQDLATQHDLTARNLLQTFGPDEPSEARNRSFRRV